MNLSERVAVCVAGGLLLAGNAWAVTSDAQGNPYQSIVERNVFALKPPPDPETLKPAAPPPPPIELQGITSMFGRQQVLFSATVSGKPGEPPKKTGMILKVGERDNDIEVLEINEAAGTVKFNNHGTEEVKNLEKDSTKVAAIPVAPIRPGAPAPPPAIPQGNSGGVPSFGTPGATLRNIPSRTLRGPTTGTIPRQDVRTPPPLSPDEQILHKAIVDEDIRNREKRGEYTAPPPPSPPGLP